MSKELTVYSGILFTLHIIGKHLSVVF